MKIYNKLLKNLNGVINVDTINTKYHKPLPSELEKWYVYILDGGHSIFVLLKQFEKELKDNPKYSYTDFMIPCPVKTVLKGYSINSDGIIIVDGLKYNSQIGLIIDEEDEEYSNINISKEIVEGSLALSITHAEDGTIVTNFWETEWNKRNYLYLTVGKNNIFHLLIPSSMEYVLDEMETGKYVVLTTGKTDGEKALSMGTAVPDNVEMIELMFEDNTESPYCSHISISQCTYQIGADFNHKKSILKIYTENEEMELDLYIRSGKEYVLPYAKPIDTKTFIKINR